MSAPMLPWLSTAVALVVAAYQHWALRRMFSSRDRWRQHAADWLENAGEWESIVLTYRDQVLRARENRK